MIALKFVFVHVAGENYVKCQTLSILEICIVKKFSNGSSFIFKLYKYDTIGLNPKDASINYVDK